MRKYCLLLALVLPAAITLPAQAGILFGKHAKANPSQRVPELIALVKTDKNEGTRESAAKELREYDSTTFTDIVPVLIDVLQHDPTPAVRVEAAQSLGKLRPVSQVAGWALEEALKDSSIRVRMQARTSLMSYHLGGYRSDAHLAQAPMPAAQAVPDTQASPATTSFSMNPFKRSTSVPAPQSRIISTTGETPPPPLAQPSTGPTYPTGVPQRLVPTDVPKLQKPPSGSNDAGPDLNPGKN